MKISCKAAWGVLAWVIGPLSAAALTPDQLVLIVNSNSAASEQVAQHYLTARQVPVDHVVRLALPLGDTISAENYEKLLATPLRLALRDKGLDEKTTCLVTTYDVPIRVDNQLVTPAEQTELKQRQEELKAAIATLRQMPAKYDAILPTAATTAPAVVGAAAASERLVDIVKPVETAARAALDRLNHANGIEKMQAGPAFIELQRELTGTLGVSRMVRFSNATQDTDKLEVMQQEMVMKVQAAQKRIDALSLDAENAKNRQEILDLRKECYGLVGVVQSLDQMMPVIQHTESYAAVDSELMLLWVQHFSRVRWLPNPKCLTVYPYLPARQKMVRIMMTSRLDGASVDQVNAMVDTSIEVEKKGLEGTIYLDARGLHGTDGYGEFDAELRTCANYLRDNTKVNVVLDDKPELLQAADCPNAAFYCGWYSLRHYVDSCQWLPGSVGYHVASAEMETLHDAAERGWVVNMLDRGVCGTLGAVREPYLVAFPRPTLFFPLVLSGQFTQAEVYYLTAPVTSWCISYVGDPLYNPCKVNPKITAAQLKEHSLLRNANTILGMGVPTTMPTLMVP